eukprot:1925267-Amphidinium_carterae.1
MLAGRHESAQLLADLQRLARPQFRTLQKHNPSLKHAQASILPFVIRSATVIHHALLDLVPLIGMVLPQTY